MIERFKYWLFQRGKDCYHCCLRCEYFDICRWDVMTGKTAEQEQTVELLAVEAARKNGNTGLLYRIYKYVEFKKGERRKHRQAMRLVSTACGTLRGGRGKRTGLLEVFVCKWGAWGD